MVIVRTNVMTLLAEDMLRKISLSEDVHPAISSGAGIAEDSHRVWCGDVSPGGVVAGIKVG